MKAHIARAALVCALIHSASPVLADHWMQTADPQVVQALNELGSVYGSYCQQGNQQACGMAQSVQSHGAQMLNAGYDCKINGNQQACDYYQNAYGMLSNTYAQTMQAMQQGQVSVPQSGGANPLGASHQERMQAIQNWGQDRLQWGSQRSLDMDRQHETFMNSLRN